MCPFHVLRPNFGCLGQKGGTDTEKKRRSYGRRSSFDGCKRLQGNVLASYHNLCDLLRCHISIHIFSSVSKEVVAVRNKLSQTFLQRFLHGEI